MRGLHDIVYALLLQTNRPQRGAVVVFIDNGRFLFLVSTILDIIEGDDVSL